jgi:hypothetical protein
MSNTHAKFSTLADLEKQRLEILKQQWVKKSENPIPQKPEEQIQKPEQQRLYLLSSTTEPLRLCKNRLV